MELIRFKKDEVPNKDFVYITHDKQQDEYLRMYWDDYGDYWRIENYFNCTEGRMFVERADAYEEVLKGRTWVRDDVELDKIFQESNKDALKKIFKGKK